jgi:hypothetical protein
MRNGERLIFFKAIDLLFLKTMRIVQNRFLILFTLLFGVLNDMVAGPPEPAFAGKKKPPPPPGLPIDQEIIFLLIVALILGIYIIYTRQIKTKTPV